MVHRRGEKISSQCQKTARILVSPAGQANRSNIQYNWITDFHVNLATLAYLARLGLPAVSRKKNVLLTRPVESRWLDISLVLSLQVYGPRLHLGHKHAKKQDFATTFSMGNWGWNQYVEAEVWKLAWFSRWRKLVFNRRLFCLDMVSEISLLKWRKWMTIGSDCSMYQIREEPLPVTLCIKSPPR